MAARAAGGEQPGARREAGRDFVEQRAILLDRGPGAVGKRREAVFVALAAYGDQRLAGAGDGARQGDQLGDAQARGVEQLDQARHARRRQPLARRPGRVLQTLAGDLDEFLDLRHAEQLGQRARPSWAFDRQRRD